MKHRLIANFIAFSERESERELLRLSVSRLSVRLSSVTFVHPTHAVDIFGNVSTPFGIPWPSVDIHGKFYGDRPRGTYRWGS